MWVAVGTAAVGLVGSVYASNKAAGAAKDAAQTQADAAASANAQQRADQAPWTAAGGDAITQLGQDIKPGGQFNKPFTMADATNSTAEQHALSQGKLAIDNSAAARGGLLSTNDIQDNTKFAEGTAASFQNQAFNQWLQQNQQALGAKESVARTGQASATNVADSSANLTLGAANAQAAGTVGAANATTNGVAQISNQMGTLASLFGNKSQPDATHTVYPGATTPTGISGDAGNIGAGYASTDYSLSDKRVKTNIKRVGTTTNGLPIYTYRMKGGGPVKMGLMAQDVEKVNPKAVIEDQDGIKMLNYAEAV